MGLSKNDYENLLKFSAFITKDFEKFSDNVLFALDEFFQFPLTVYTVFNEDLSGALFVEKIQSNSICPEGLHAYRHGGVRSDLFVQRVHHGVQGTIQKNVIVIPDIAGYDEFYRTEYGKYLQSINTPYQAVLRYIKAQTFPFHILNVFKTKEQGEFTEYELKLLTKIGQVFGFGVDLYKRHLFQQHYLEFLTEETTALDHNLAILDEKGIVVFRNEGFVRLSMECFGIRSEQSCVTVVLDALQAKTGLGLSGVFHPVVLEFSDFRVEVRLCHSSLPQSSARFYFLSVRRVQHANPANAQDDWRRQLADEYNLTPRETEIIGFLTNGRSNAEIAANLCVSIPTVKFHVQNIFHKLEVTNRSSAIAKLLRQG
ncbi:MAG: LuxR C-terminal-related transcriptional regulator [Clostridiales Family XIII bacterium]|jgi:DNA-binding CsgD family transcriptional regulator|nr:LuxR C-terminal-related transcriptional regulator [Clostridiales Family XIII bacterium]